MYLSRLKAQGFRSLHQNLTGDTEATARQGTSAFENEPGLEIRLDRLSVLIGCNDAGKSSVLDLLDLVLNGGRPDINDFHCRPEEATRDTGTTGTHRLNEIGVLLEFRLEGDRDVEAIPYSCDGTLLVRAVFTPDSSGVFYWGEIPQDERLAQDFGRMRAAEQIELIQDIDPSALENLSNVDQRAEWLRQYAEIAPKLSKWIPVPRGFAQLLPRFERYSTMDYAAPENLVMKTLRQVYESVVFEEVEIDGAIERRPVEAIRDIKSKVEDSVHSRVQELRGYIVRYNPRVIGISLDPTLDFSGGLRAGQFQIDDGHGMMYLSKVGDGTKRRVFMAVVDWDREVTVAQAEAGSTLPSIIRGYDEPDTNLDYQAQRRMYGAISEMAESDNSRIQAIVCTHSPRLIDQAPAQSIRLLQWEDGCTSVAQLETDSDPEVERFLSSLARELGMSNTLMFYERCFILIEGPTEENALPLLYRARYGHSLLEDGIRVVSVQSNGAFREFFKLLSRNRQAITVVLADLDTETSREGRRLTREVLRYSHFSQNFVDTHIHYIPAERVGENGEEFESAFSNEIIARCLQAQWPKEAGAWTPQDIEQIRTVPNKKFADELKNRVWREATQTSNQWSKPDFGNVLCQQRW